MTKKICRAGLLALVAVMFMTCFACLQPVSAAGKADLKKANVKWDLKKNKKIKYKTAWSYIGAKQNTVKMTNYKVKKAKKKGYKQCTFKLTFTRPDIKMTDSQIEKMELLAMEYNLREFTSENAPFGGGCYYTVVDYKTGKSLEGKNSKKVKVTRSDWKFSNYVKKVSSSDPDTWIRYAKKTTVNVKIVYPKKYKNLAIGVGGYTAAPELFTESFGGGASSGFKTLNLNSYWKGKKAFSKETRLYSKKDKSYAHFMRVK